MFVLLYWNCIISVHRPVNSSSHSVKTSILPLPPAESTLYCTTIHIVFFFCTEFGGHVIVPLVAKCREFVCAVGLFHFGVQRTASFLRPFSKWVLRISQREQGYSFVILICCVRLEMDQGYFRVKRSSEVCHVFSNYHFLYQPVPKLWLVDNIRQHIYCGINILVVTLRHCWLRFLWCLLINTSICRNSCDDDGVQCSSLHLSADLTAGSQLKIHRYRVIQNDCRGSNNLSYTIHLR